MNFRTKKKTGISSPTLKTKGLAMKSTSHISKIKPAPNAPTTKEAGGCRPTGI